MTQQLQIVLQMSKNHLAGLAQAATDPADKAKFAADLAAVEAQLGLIAGGGVTAPTAIAPVAIAPGGTLSPEKGALLRKAVKENDRATILATVGGENGWAVCPATDKEKAMAVFGGDAAARKAVASALFAEILDSAESAGYSREMGEALAGDATSRAVRAAISDARAAVAKPMPSAEIDWKTVGTVAGVVVVIVGAGLGAYVAYDKYGR